MLLRPWELTWERKAAEAKMENQKGRKGLERGSERRNKALERTLLPLSPAPGQPGPLESHLE